MQHPRSLVRRSREQRLAISQRQEKPAPSAIYTNYLRSHPAETDQLFKDLPIGVTSFFSDREAFDELEHALGRERTQGYEPGRSATSFREAL